MNCLSLSLSLSYIFLLEIFLSLSLSHSLSLTRVHTRTSSSSPNLRKMMQGSRSFINLNSPPRYDADPDDAADVAEVLVSLVMGGLGSLNIIFGIAWKGNLSFIISDPHATGSTHNQYEEVISILGKTLAPLIEGKMIPCYGFGDQTTQDIKVFSFHKDCSPCHNIKEVLSCFRKILPNLQLAEPTSFAPVVEAAINIVEKSGGQFHTLFIITDGQVTRGIDISDEELSPQEDQTIKSIVNASSHPLSIVVVGVGDGPWEDMQKFKEKIPAREFDNFKFIKFAEFMSEMAPSSNNEKNFSSAALMDISILYKKAMELGMLRRVTGKAKKISPLPPPGTYSQWAKDVWSDLAVCPNCGADERDMAFNCGHMTCRSCGNELSKCPICCKQIKIRIPLWK